MAPFEPTDSLDCVQDHIMRKVKLQVLVFIWLQNSWKKKFQAKLHKVCFLILAAPSESIDWTMFAIILNTVWNCKDSCLYSWSTLVLLNLNNLIVFRIILNTVWNCKFLSLSSSRTFGRFILGLLDVSFGINLSRSSKPTDLVDCAQGSYYQQSEIVNSFLWIAA